MLDVAVIEDPAAAAVALDPIRARLLAALTEPASAGGLANALGIARQKLNYHLRQLEDHGLVELAGTRKRGGLTERLLQATAVTFVVSPAALNAGGADPDLAADRFSAGHLVALAGRIVREVGAMARAAAERELRLPTFTIDTEVRFTTPEARAAFADELTAAVAEIVARHHHDDGRPHRLIVASHPKPLEEQP